MKTKEKILNKLSGEFDVIKIEKNFDEDISIICKFMKNGKIGEFEYVLEGRERGIYEVKGYDEEEGENIFGEIQDWVDEHIECETIVKCKGKEIEWT